MKTPVDRDDQPLSAYLLKILTILVKKSGGEIRIDANDMLDDSSGEGLSKRYDRDKKQLVLSFIESGSEIYFNKSGDDEWQSNLLSPKSRQSSQLSPSQRSGLVRPLRQSDLTENYPSPSESLNRSASTLDDQRLSDLEDSLRKEAAARLIANFPSTPVTEPSDRPRVMRDQPRRVQQSFYRD